MSQGVHEIVTSSISALSCISQHRGNRRIPIAVKKRNVIFFLNTIKTQIGYKTKNSSCRSFVSKCKFHDPVILGAKTGSNFDMSDFTIAASFVIPALCNMPFNGNFKDLIMVYKNKVRLSRHSKGSEVKILAI